MVPTDVGVEVRRLLIADDDPLVLRMLAAAVEAEPDLEIVATASDGDAAVEAAMRTRPDLVLLDVSMPGGGGVAAAREISRQLPETRLVAFSGHDDPSNVRSMLDARVDRYVVKTTALVELMGVMRSVLSERSPPAPEPTADAEPVETAKVLLAIRDPAELLALAQAVDAEQSMEVVGLAQTAGHAARLAYQHRPDVAVVASDLEGGGGRAAAAAISSASSGTEILGLWGEWDRHDPVGAIRNRLTGRWLTRSDEIHDHLRRAIDGDGLRTLRQPIVDLDSGRTVGFEALTRITHGPSRPVDMWFGAATALGLGEALEVTAARSAIALLPEIPRSAFLSINVSPAVAVSARFARLIEPSIAERIVLEVTEQAPVEDYEELAEALSLMRMLGARVAIDDAGAGFASLRHVLNLAPEFIKLDNSLCHGIGGDGARTAMARSMVAFSGETGSVLIAEGLEDEDDVRAVRDLSVPLGQGYALGRPA